MVQGLRFKGLGLKCLGLFGFRFRFFGCGV